MLFRSSIEFVHERIIAARDRGAAVLLVSAELDEVLGLSDRIAVMYDGRLVDTMAAKHADRARIGLLLAGQTATASPASPPATPAPPA